MRLKKLGAGTELVYIKYYLDRYKITTVQDYHKLSEFAIPKNILKRVKPRIILL
jgi:hypothetical protein